MLRSLSGRAGPLSSRSWAEPAPAGQLNERTADE